MKKGKLKPGIIAKSNLEGRVEPFIIDLLAHEKYEIEQVSASNLLTWNRLDLAFKLLYLDLKDRHPDLARAIYRHDIRSQTLGTYIEHENEDKDSFEQYVLTFDRISEDILVEGFDSSQSLVPLSATGAIFNGAHRVASAIHAGTELSCVRTELPIHVCDYRFYRRSGVPSELIEMAVQKYIEHAPDIYIGFLWPSGLNNVGPSEEEFSNVIYKKKINLSLNGGRNLLLELYQHMDWIGSRKNGYSGINQKLIECFPNDGELTVIVFQAESIEHVRHIKARVRAIHGIGFSSIHITDTIEEAVRVSRLLFNERGLHFLNHAVVDKFDTKAEIHKFQEFIGKCQLENKDIMIDGSFILTLYGIRDSWDIDFLSQRKVNYESSYFEPHDDQLQHHAVSKAELLYNPEYHFVFSNLKFVSFEQLRRMKARRNEVKDRHDVAAMSRIQEPASLVRLVHSCVQKVFFLQLRVRTSARNSFVLLLKKIGLYAPARRIYWRLMR